MSATTQQPADANPKTYTAINARESSKTDLVAKGTARKDTVERILRNEWVNGAVCREELSDDYKRDAARNFGKGSVSTDYILDKMDTVDPKHCWVEEDTDGRQLITVYWSFQRYDIVLDLREVRFAFDVEDEDADEDTDEDDHPEPAGSPAEVFEMLETDDSVIWDGKSKPLKVTTGFEDAKERQADGIDFEPAVWLEGPRGGEKRLRRSENGTVRVDAFTMSSSPSAISGLRIVDDE